MVELASGLLGACWRLLITCRVKSRLHNSPSVSNKRGDQANTRELCNLLSPFLVRCKGKQQDMTSGVLLVVQSWKGNPELPNQQSVVARHYNNRNHNDRVKGCRTDVQRGTDFQQPRALMVCSVLAHLPMYTCVCMCIHIDIRSLT